MFVFANLSQQQIENVQEFEKHAGMKLLAVKELPIEFEPISADKLTALHDLEKQLGVCLLAVR